MSSGAPRVSHAWRLGNVEERARKFPDTFHIPNAARRHSLKVGDHAKLCFEIADGTPSVGRGERMWVKVTRLDSPAYYGVVVNRSVIKVFPAAGALVQFGPEHVADIEPGREVAP